MNGRYLLDTNIVIALFAREADVLKQLEVAEQVFIPAIALGELFYGAQKSAHKKANVTLIEDFAVKSSVLVCDTETARIYGKIKEHLRIKGRPLPENDIWIASIAEQHQLSLVTRDQHFQYIKGLKLEAWQDR